MWKYFALPAVRAGDVGRGDDFGGDEVMIHPCCTTMPMGWSHAVFLAQSAHEHIVKVRVGLDADDAVSHSTDIRLDRVRHMIYVDDFVLIGLHHHSRTMSNIQSRYASVMSNLGLPTKPSKHVDPSSEGVKCIGVVVHGKDLTVGVRP